MDLQLVFADRGQWSPPSTSSRSAETFVGRWETAVGSLCAHTHKTKKNITKEQTSHNEEDPNTNPTQP